MTRPGVGPRGEPAQRTSRRLRLKDASVLVAVAIGLGCTTNPSPRTSSHTTSASEHFDEALAARSSGDLESAAYRLRVVRERCSGEPLGDQAFLLLAATRLDPRYRERPPDSAAAETARYLSRDSASRWAEAMAESLHLIARDMGGSPGATDDPPASGPRSGRSGCESRWARDAEGSDEARALPALSRPSLHGRILDLRGVVDSLEAEVTRLRELLKTPRR